MEQAELATLVCSLFFPDGSCLAAQIRSTSPYQDCVVEYSGPVHRIPIAFATANSVLLRALFQSFARELGAKFHEELIGAWERDPEDEWLEGGPEAHAHDPSSQGHSLSK